MTRKYKQAIFHFGGDKTGSTSLQQAFDHSREILLQKGVLAYPPKYNHGWVGSFFSDSPENYVLNAAAKLSNRSDINDRDTKLFTELENWIESTPACDILLFSYEGFLSMNARAMQKMRNFAASLAEEVKVVLYIRPPLSYAVSAMSQRVRTGRKSWEDCIVWSYRQHIEKCIAAFGRDNVVLRVFSPSTLKKQNIVEDFIDLLKLPEKIIKEIPKSHFSNPSMSSAGLKLGDILIDCLKKYATKTGHQMSYAGFSKRFGRFLFNIPGGKIKLSQEQIEKIIAASQSDSQFLEKEFGIIFSEDVNYYLQTSSDASETEDEMVAALSTLFINFAAQVSSPAKTQGNFRKLLTKLGLT